MQILPALKTATFLAFGITLSYWITFDSTVLITCTILFLTLSILLDRYRIGQFFLITSLISAASLSYSSTSIENYKSVHGSIQGVVTQPPIFHDKWMSFPVSIGQLGHSKPLYKASGNLWIILMDVDHQIKSGVTVEVTGNLQPLKPRRNPGDFDLKGWRQRNGYIGEMFVASSNSVLIIDSKPSWIYKLRIAIATRIEHYFKHDAPFITALILGIRRGIDDDMLENMRKAGLSHLLALSGLHVGFLTGILWGLGALFRLRYNWRVVWVLLFLILFLMIVPHRSSTLRATIMAVSFLVSPLVRKWSHPLNTMGIASLVILCLRPGDLFDAGFQLSFAAVGGILLYNPVFDQHIILLKRRYGRSGRLALNYFVVPLIVSTSASMMVVPLTSYHFGTMALGSPLFNIFAIPLLAAIYAGSWIVLLFSLINTWLTGLIADGLSGILYLWDLMVGFFGTIAPIYSVRLSPFITGSLLCFVAIGSAIKQKKSLLILSLSIITLLQINSFIPNPLRFQVWFIDVGHGDAAVWRFPNGRTAVIDGGPTWRNSEVGRMVQVLDYWNCDQIDILVASHPEADHISGLLELIEQYPIGLAIASPSVSPSHIYAQLCSLSTDKELFWYKSYAGMSVLNVGDDCVVDILGPPRGSDSWSSNNASLVMKLTLQIDNEPLSILTTGDVERLGEDALINRGGIEADLLKVSHHGSGTSTSSDFIYAVQPDIAIISRGVSESMGAKLSDEVVTNFEDRNIELHSTHQDGAILCEPTVDSSGVHWRVVNWRKPHYIRWLFGV